VHREIKENLVTANLSKARFWIGQTGIADRRGHSFGHEHLRLGFSRDKNRRAGGITDCRRAGSTGGAGAHLHRARTDAAPRTPKPFAVDHERSSCDPLDGGGSDSVGANAFAAEKALPDLANRSRRSDPWEEPGAQPPVQPPRTLKPFLIVSLKARARLKVTGCFPSWVNATGTAALPQIAADLLEHEIRQPRATPAHAQQQTKPYSITSSARVRSEAGISGPIR